MAEELWEARDEFDIITRMNDPLPDHQMRVMFCRNCGVVTYIHQGGNPAGLGDPLQHHKFHAAMNALRQEVDELRERLERLGG